MKKYFLNILSVFFLVATLGTATYFASNTEIKQLINPEARYSPDALIRQRERKGGCTGAGCLAPEILNNRDDPANQVGVAAQIVSLYDQSVTGDQNAIEQLGEYNSNLANSIQRAVDEAQTTQTQASDLDICLQDGGFIQNGQCVYQDIRQLAQELVVNPNLDTMLAKDARDAQNAAIYADNAEDRNNALQELANLAQQNVITPDKFYQIVSQTTSNTIRYGYYDNEGNLVEGEETPSQQMLNAITSQNPIGGQCVFNTDCANSYCSKSTSNSIAMGTCQVSPVVEDFLQQNYGLDSLSQNPTAVLTPQQMSQVAKDREGLPTGLITDPLYITAIKGLQGIKEDVRNYVNESAPALNGTYNFVTNLPLIGLERIANSSQIALMGADPTIQGGDAAFVGILNLLGITDVVESSNRLFYQTGMTAEQAAAYESNWGARFLDASVVGTFAVGSAEALIGAYGLTNTTGLLTQSVSTYGVQGTIFIEMAKHPKLVGALAIAGAADDVITLTTCALNPNPDVCSETSILLGVSGLSEVTLLDDINDVASIVGRPLMGGGQTTSLINAVDDMYSSGNPVTLTEFDLPANLANDNVTTFDLMTDLNYQADLSLPGPLALGVEDIISPEIQGVPAVPNSGHLFEGVDPPGGFENGSSIENVLADVGATTPKAPKTDLIGTSHVNAGNNVADELSAEPPIAVLEQPVAINTQAESGASNISGWFSEIFNPSLGIVDPNMARLMNLELPFEWRGIRNTAGNLQFPIGRVADKLYDPIPLKPGLPSTLSSGTDTLLFDVPGQSGVRLTLNRDIDGGALFIHNVDGANKIVINGQEIPLNTNVRVNVGDEFQVNGKTLVASYDPQQLYPKLFELKTPATSPIASTGIWDNITTSFNQAITTPISKTLNDITNAWNKAVVEPLADFLADRFGIAFNGINEPYPFFSNDSIEPYPFQYPRAINGGRGTTPRLTVVNSEADKWLDDATDLVNTGLSRDMNPTEYFNASRKKLGESFSIRPTTQQLDARSKLARSGLNTVGQRVECMGGNIVCFEGTAVLHEAGAKLGYESVTARAPSTKPDTAGHAWLEFVDGGEVKVIDSMHFETAVSQEYAYEYYKKVLDLDTSQVTTNIWSNPSNPPFEKPSIAGLEWKEVTDTSGNLQFPIGRVTDKLYEPLALHPNSVSTLSSGVDTLLFDVPGQSGVRLTLNRDIDGGALFIHNVDGANKIVINGQEIPLNTNVRVNVGDEFQVNGKTLVASYDPQQLYPKLFEVIDNSPLPTAQKDSGIFGWFGRALNPSLGIIDPNMERIINFEFNFEWKGFRNADTGSLQWPLQRKGVSIERLRPLEPTILPRATRVTLDNSVVGRVKAAATALQEGVVKRNVLSYLKDTPYLDTPGTIIEIDGKYFHVQSGKGTDKLKPVVPIFEGTVKLSKPSEYPSYLGPKSLQVVYDGKSYYYEYKDIKQEITELGIMFDDGSILRYDPSIGGVTLTTYDDTLLKYGDRFFVEYRSGAFVVENNNFTGTKPTLWMKNGEIPTTRFTQLDIGDTLTTPQGYRYVLTKTDNGYQLKEYFDPMEITHEETDLLGAIIDNNSANPDLIAYVRKQLELAGITPTAWTFKHDGSLHGFSGTYNINEYYTKLLSDPNFHETEQFAARRAVYQYLLDNDPAFADLYKKFVLSKGSVNGTPPLTLISNYDFEIKKLERLSALRSLTDAEKQYLDSARKLKNMWELITTFSPDAISYTNKVLDDIDPIIRKQLDDFLDQAKNLKIEDTPLNRSFMERRTPTSDQYGTSRESVLGFLPLGEPFTRAFYAEMAFGTSLAPGSYLSNHQVQTNSFWRLYQDEKGITFPDWMKAYIYRGDEFTFMTRANTYENNLANAGGNYFMRGDLSEEELTHIINHEATHNFVSQSDSPRIKRTDDFVPVPSQQGHNEITTEFIAQMVTSGSIKNYPPKNPELFTTLYQEGVEELATIFKEIDAIKGEPMFSFDLLIKGITDFNEGIIDSPLKYVHDFYAENLPNNTDFFDRLAKYSDHTYKSTTSGDPVEEPSIINILDPNTGLTPSKTQITKTGGVIHINNNSKPIKISERGGLNITMIADEIGYQLQKINLIDPTTNKLKLPFEIKPIKDIMQNFSALFSKSGPPIKSGEIFNPRVELDRIRHLPTKDRRVALNQYKEKLQYQQQGYSEIEGLLIKTISENPDIDRTSLRNVYMPLIHKYGLADEEVINIIDALAEYQFRRDWINYVFKQYNEPWLMYEAMFGKLPNGLVKVEKGLTTIHMKIYDADDFGFARLYGKAYDATLADKYVGFSLLVDTNIPGSKGLVVVDNNTPSFAIIKEDDFPSDDVFKHEDQHQLFALLQKSRVIPSKKYIDLTNAELAFKEALKNASGAELDSAIRDYAIALRDQADIQIVDEMMAFFKTGYPRESIYKLLIDNYNFYGRAYLKINQPSIPYETFERIHAIRNVELNFNEDQKKIINAGLEAFDGLIAKGYTVDEAIIALERVPLSKWEKYVSGLTGPSPLTEAQGLLSGSQSLLNGTESVPTFVDNNLLRNVNTNKSFYQRAKNSITEIWAYFNSGVSGDLIKSYIRNDEGTFLPKLFGTDKLIGENVDAPSVEAPISEVTKTIPEITPNAPSEITKTWIDDLPYKKIKGSQYGDVLDTGELLMLYASHWEGKWDPKTERLILNPVKTPTTVSYNNGFYDSTLAYIEDEVPTLKPESKYVVIEMDPENGDLFVPGIAKNTSSSEEKLIFRGINYEGMQTALNEGEFRGGPIMASHGEGGIFFGTSGERAIGYAAKGQGNFAMATFEKPSYVIIIKKPTYAITDPLGDIIVTKPIPLTNIEKIYEVRPYYMEPGNIPLRAQKIEYNGQDISQMQLGDIFSQIEGAPKAQFAYRELSLEETEEIFGIKRSISVSDTSTRELIKVTDNIPSSTTVKWNGFKNPETGKFTWWPFSVNKSNVSIGIDTDEIISLEDAYKEEISSPALARRKEDLQVALEGKTPKEIADLIYDAKYTDSMTGLINKAGFAEGLDLEVNNALINKQPLSVMSIDLKNFGSINDDLGHLAGDEALIEFAKILKKNARSTDLVVRVGGDEFAIIMPNTTQQEAENMAKRILDQIADQKKLAMPNALIHRINPDYGIKEWGKTDTIEGFLGDLDAKMYHMKRSKTNLQTPILIAGTIIGSAGTLGLNYIYNHWDEISLWISERLPSPIENQGEIGSSKESNIFIKLKELILPSPPKPDALKVIPLLLPESQKIYSGSTAQVFPTTNETIDAKYSGVQFLNDTYNNYSNLNQSQIVSIITSAFPEKASQISSLSQGQKFSLYLQASLKNSPYSSLLTNQTFVGWLNNEVASWYGYTETVGGIEHSQLTQCVLWENTLDYAFPELGLVDAKDIKLQNASDVIQYAEGTGNSDALKFNNSVNGITLSDLINNPQTRLEYQNQDLSFYLEGLNNGQGAIFAHKFDSISDAQPGDAIVYGNHMAAILEIKYDQNGNPTSLLITEANSPKGDLDGTPIIYEAPISEFEELFAPLDQTLFVRNESYDYYIDWFE